MMATMPGMRLFHEGQFEGRTLHVPVHLGRRRIEQPHEAVQDFYSTLLEVITPLRAGEWLPAEVQAGIWHIGVHHVFAWQWRVGGETHVVVVNFGHRKTTARIPMLGGGEQVFSEGMKIQKSGKMSAGPWGYGIVKI